MSRSASRFAVRASLLATLLALLVVPAAGAGFRESHEFATDRLEVANLIGAIRVETASGSQFEVAVDVRGQDATKDRVRVEVQRDALAVVFPLDESRHYRYPELGGGEVHMDVGEGDGWLSSLLGGLLGRNDIEVSGRGSGLELWADVTVRVPRGRTLELKHGVGGVSAAGVQGDLTLRTRAGSVDVSGVRGKLVVDTGSGSVKATDVDGPTLIDTGSGRVVLERARGDEITVDTGSGSVKIDDVDSRRLVVDTGSGRIEARRVRADSALLDTGSGSVSLQLDRMGTGRFEVDTGSGGIELVLPRDASAEITADTGSGGIDVALDGAAEVRQPDHDEAWVRVGAGGARVTLDSGSGSIRISY